MQTMIQQGQQLTDYANYDITVERIAEGGFGLVAMGPCRRHNDQWFALKTLKPAGLEDEEACSRFLRECLTWVAFWPHPNIARAGAVTDISMPDFGLVPFIAIPHAEMGNLRNALAAQDPPLAIRLHWAQQIAAGLVYLHTPDATILRDQPLVHRDLKPENVLITREGEALITDFGLSKAMQDGQALLPREVSGAAATDHQRLEGRNGGEIVGPLVSLFTTARGVGLGTIQYMAPEQWIDAAVVGPPADIYAFGLILSELLTDRHALEEIMIRDVESWRRIHTEAQPRGLREVRPEIPEEIERLYIACLAKDPANRPSAREVLTTLRASAFANDLPTYVPYEAIPRTPANMAAWWHNTSQAYLTHQLYDEALERNTQALTTVPDASERWTLFMTRGNILMPMGQIDDGLAAFDQALANCSADDHANRGMILTNRGSHLSLVYRFADAEEAFATAAIEAPDTFVVWYNRARNEGNWAIIESTAEPKNYSSACSHAARGLAHIRRAMQISSSDPEVQVVHAQLEQLERTLCNASAHLQADSAH
jgi:serine/threonine protein kinase